MKTPFKELINGRYFWILFLCALIILKLVVENFEMSDQLAKSMPTIKLVSLILFLIVVAHFVLSLLIILVTMLISGTYDKWIQKNKVTNLGKTVDSFINPAYISLALTIYGIYTYFSLTLSWSLFLLLIGVQIARNIYSYITEKKTQLPRPE